MARASSAVSKRMGAVIRAVREEQGLTQEEVAAAYGATDGAIASYEQGRSRFTVQDLPAAMEHPETIRDSAEVDLIRDTMYALVNPAAILKEGQIAVLVTGMRTNPPPAAFSVVYFDDACPKPLLNGYPNSSLDIE